MSFGCVTAVVSCLSFQSFLYAFYRYMLCRPPITYSFVRFFLLHKGAHVIWIFLQVVLFS